MGRKETAFPLPQGGNSTADGRFAWLAKVCDASIGLFPVQNDVPRDLMEGTVACTVAGLIRDYAAAFEQVHALARVLRDCREHLDAAPSLKARAERALFDAAQVDAS